ncbi:type III-B CRISPR module RAMP protein Cmr6 [Tuwongella immobilis]|uniref:CRISPR type III-associated protein domain-containing protein n=1 Tax=Tuwongella immobilis TaxID=692036 RepID=A0A6C2YLP7_9BACT|nr:type III-B CRISPR module RAMP protein Cmr6 [Tuwongella immobilis]VIP02241.1 CRISPR-associated RAMP protein, Cmr6 family OS=Fretibacterium fastidiosum GN=SY1_18820 PE=4 SV=1: RAMPs [Tuwongella immobilis]VTS00810.1 CRISPR-associated RAMP protein, Cmr6 family OS=Fretibacterium fastidiosum GN=SY1_18820 PE=4 SV=1: RAMPs [Tuwongella immobilis]
MREPIAKLNQKPNPVRSMGQHPGLLLHRYLDRVATGKASESGDPQAKTDLHRDATKAASDRDVHALYKSAYDRWQQQVALIPESLRQTAEMKSLGRLIVGLGTENVLETGIRLHHTYGMPVLPGSALKGLAAHYCHTVWGEADPRFRRRTEPKPETDDSTKSPGKAKPVTQKTTPHEVLFGDTDEAGFVIFHDGWMVPPENQASPLVEDVMTPHHPEWLEGKVAPSDFDSPVPVPFLAVEGTFALTLTWCGPEPEKCGPWMKLAMELLTEALAEWGIGGKTSSGYGRFDLEHYRKSTEERVKKKAAEDAKAAEEAKLASMSPLERRIEEILAKRTNQNEKRFHINLITALRENKLFTDEAERKAIAAVVKARMEADKLWGKKDEQSRVALIKQILGES